MTRKFVLHTHKKVDATDFAEALNEEQLAVATAPGGPMLVVAGAGTGKTRALTYRLAWLVRAGVDPGRILLVTFTNRAAREMVHRVELLVEQADAPPLGRHVPPRRQPHPAAATAASWASRPNSPSSTARTPPAC